MLSLKVLLIDDNKDITDMFAKFFTIKGHQTIVSNSGRNGLAMIENESCDVIILDLAMPEFSGRDIVDHLHKNGTIHKHLIVSLTASSISDDDKTYLVDKGVHSVLKKPIDPDQLLDYLIKLTPKKNG
jgi:CheY-like chemotaxis protein